MAAGAHRKGLRSINPCQFICTVNMTENMGIISQVSFMDKGPVIPSI